jgi:uncharacterized protein (DUF2164 family)
MNFEIINVNQKETNSTTIPQEDINLWHRRYAHLGFENLKRVTKMVDGFNITSKTKRTRFCEACIEAKETRRPFKTSKHPKSTEPLELIFGDIVVVNVKSRLNEIYAFVLMDDYTSMKFTFPMKKKSDVAEYFISWASWIERQTGNRIKKFRSDNAKEFVFGELGKYFKEKGIEAQQTEKYEHEQGGSIERCNRTIFDKARSLLIDSGLKKEFWRDAVLTSTYLANRSPVYNQDITPYEAMTKKKPNVEHLKVFGSKAWARIPAEKLRGRNKMNSRVTAVRIIGYTKDSNCYSVVDQLGNVFTATLTTSTRVRMMHKVWISLSMKKDAKEWIGYNVCSKIWRI